MTGMRGCTLGLLWALGASACTTDDGPGASTNGGGTVGTGTTSGVGTATGTGTTGTSGGTATTAGTTTGAATTGTTGASTSNSATTGSTGTTGASTSDPGATGSSTAGSSAGSLDAAVPDAGGEMDSGGESTPETGTFPPVTDLSEDGPFVAVTVQNTGPSDDYTLYHPQTLAEGGVLHPIGAWGNGGATTPVDYDYLLPHLATHGFVVIASNNPLVGSPDMRAGVDWVIQQNDASDSALYQALDVANVSAVGYSNGGLATLGMGDDSRLVTVIVISGGSTSEDARATNIPKLHTPTAYLCTEDDASRGNCAGDYAVITVPAFFGVLNGSTHVSVTEFLGLGNDAIMERLSGAVTGWLRWHQMSDATQEALFLGDDCGLCADSNWTVEPPKNW